MRIFIAEDEPLAAAKLKLFLEKLGEGQDVTLFSDGKTLIDKLVDTSSQKPDLLFMDIQMPHLTGLDVLKGIGDHNFPIILTTAYDKYAIDGFNFGVTDYLLKPYTLERLSQALQKAKLLIQINDQQTQLSPKAPSNTSISIRCDGRNELVSIHSIESLEALKDYTCLHLDDGRRLTTLGTLSSIEQQLPSAVFVRIQRSYVVNINKIQSYSSQYIRLQSGIELPIGKTYRETLLTALKPAN